MQHVEETRAVRYQRYSQRGLVVVLVLTIVIGLALLAVAVRPDGVIAGWMPRVSVLLPVAVAVLVGALVGTLRGDRWDPNAPEARVILEDEWRRASMARALRAAFVVVLAAQAPLGLWLAGLPTPRGVMAMAIATITLGMATLVALFLFFQREVADGG